MYTIKYSLSIDNYEKIDTVPFATDYEYSQVSGILCMKELIDIISSNLNEIDVDYKWTYVKSSNDPYSTYARELGLERDDFEREVLGSKYYLNCSSDKQNTFQNYCDNSEIIQICSFLLNQIVKSGSYWCNIKVDYIYDFNDDINGDCANNNYYNLEDREGKK